MPRANGYQALQTSMIGPHGVPVEVHLQTEEMEQVAEMGITAHWVYKEGGKNDSTTAQVRAQRWLQSLVDIQQNVGNFPERNLCLYADRSYRGITNGGNSRRFCLCRAF